MITRSRLRQVKHSLHTSWPANTHAADMNDEVVRATVLLELMVAGF